MKKGFSLIELLVSLVIISIVMVFLTSFVLNLRDERGEVNIDIPMYINQASISRALNYDAIEHGGICYININDGNVEVRYSDRVTKKVLLNDNTLTYKKGNEVELVKTLNGNKQFAPAYVPSGYPKTYGNKRLQKYIIPILNGDNEYVEVVSYVDESDCQDLEIYGVEAEIAVPHH